MQLEMREKEVSCWAEREENKVKKRVLGGSEKIMRNTGRGGWRQTI